MKLYDKTTKAKHLLCIFIEEVTPENKKGKMFRFFKFQKVKYNKT